MPYDIDFKEVATTPILEILEMLGISELKEVQANIKGEPTQQLVGPCPISKTSNATAFKVTPSINRWVCFCAQCAKVVYKDGKQKRGGDVIELVKRVRNIDYRPAALEIQKHFGPDKAAANPSAKQEAASPPSKATSFDPLTYLQTLDPAHEELTGLGLAPSTFTDFQAGYCAKGLNRGRLAVAWCDMTDEIKMFIGVALKGETPTYVVPKGMTLPFWFGSNRVQEGQLWVLPTVIDVLSSAENGATNVICPLAPTNADALTSLKALLLEKNCTLEW